jgi:large subunit ribosomal protein L24
MARRFRIRRGDLVTILTGKDKGKSGDVIKVIRDRERVVVQGANMVKRHQKPQGGQQGGIIESEARIHISNVAHVDPESKKPTRVGVKFLKDGTKVRVARRSGAELD